MKEFDDITKDDEKTSLPFLHCLYTATQVDSPIKSVPVAVCEDEETVKSYQNVIDEVQGRRSQEEAAPQQAAAA